MIQGLVVVNGKIQNIQDLQNLTLLDDGNYVAVIKRLGNTKTMREFQEQYFAMIDELVRITGHSKQFFHENYKEYKKIDSTKELTDEDWPIYIENLRWWAFQEMDITI